MGLLAYSGITTKVRAMESRLLKPEQFQELAEQEDVRSAADYLKAQPAYAEVFEGLDDTKLHRGYMEQILTQSEYRDFTRLYRFSGVKQRRFLDLYFKHYEVEVIKKLLRHVLGGREGQPDLSMFQDFFEKHSDLNLELLCRAKNFSEFTEALEGTVYGELLKQMQENGQPGLFDCELKLDLFYFRSLWKLRSKILSKEERKILDVCFGSRLDLLNIQWICRARNFYRLSPAEIYALLIPVHYRLRADKVRQLVDAEDEGNTIRQAGRASDGKNAGHPAFVESDVKPDLRKDRTPLSAFSGGAGFVSVPERTGDAKDHHGAGGNPVRTSGGGDYGTAGKAVSRRFVQCGSIATKAEAAQRKREPLQTGGVTRDRENEVFKYHRSEG